ncbi:RHS repeat-associated core domain-containing protein [Thermopirellula anaerolimosa]
MKNRSIAGKTARFPHILREGPFQALPNFNPSREMGTTQRAPLVARYIDAPILRDTLTGDGSGIVAADRVFYLADANYNVTGLVKYDSQSGQWQVVERYTYTPYGVVTYRDADWTETAGSANGNTVLYTGRTLNPATSLYYYRARYYDPVLERFIARDPIESEPNAYRYVLNNPALLVDPHGYFGFGPPCSPTNVDPFAGRPDPTEGMSSYEASCYRNCIETCNEEFGWWNPQRYICRGYCDNTCTNTPDIWDLLYQGTAEQPPRLRRFEYLSLVFGSKGRMSGVYKVYMLSMSPGLSGRRRVSAHYQRSIPHRARSYSARSPSGEGRYSRRSPLPTHTEDS